ncbi:MAG TPA: exodeoxyribonuclease VII large subunit [Gemmataceae bacterium]|jgi:exodeoxyribonuclease VII large subunit|nr:exodeoxyribonuclease VII large subunit [Gemmataceae bacterium]
MNLLPPDGVKVLSVAELTREVKQLLGEAFSSVWVGGEISNVKKHSSGHIYLTLKDAEAQMPAVVWRGVAMRLRFDPHDGLEVIARGRLDVYPPHGKYQLIIEELQPKGLGALELAFRQLREKLLRLGYFDPKRKKPLPRHPRRVALVTSPTGAAVRDMLEILFRRWPAIEVWVCPVPVQGDGAAAEIAAGIGLLNRLACVDVMIVGRGGGSLEDLWAFNEEAVAHAIYQSRIPVVSGVGHEVDLTIADLVADRRALTPSEAAEIVVPSRDELLQAVQAVEGQLRQLVAGRLRLARERLADLAGRRAFQLPLERVREREQLLDDWSQRLLRAKRQHLIRLRERVEAQAARLQALSPLNVLARGYSLSRREADQAVIRSPDQVRPGDLLVTHVQHGRIISRVESAQPAASPSASAGAKDGPQFARSAHD